MKSKISHLCSYALKMILLAAVLTQNLWRLFCLTFRSPLDILFHVSLFPVEFTTPLLLKWSKKLYRNFFLLPHFLILYKTFLIVAALHGWLSLSPQPRSMFIGRDKCKALALRGPVTYNIALRCGAWAMFTTLSWTRPAFMLQLDTGNQDEESYSLFNIYYV